MPAVSQRNQVLPADPGGAYRCRRREIRAAVERVLESGWYLQGAETAAFEAEFAAYLGGGRVLGTGTGTDALVLALRACGIGPGDAVIAPAHTAVATVAAIDLVGAIPLLVDICPDTFALDPAAVAAALESEEGTRVRALLPVHLYGHPADLPALQRICRERDLRMIEDCAQAHGAAWQGRSVGTWGDAAAFSFYPTKNLAALGDGGALATTDPGVAERAALLKQYGWRERYVSAMAGMNTRLDELQAAVLRVRLAYVDAENDRRRRIADYYRAELADTGLRLPVERGPVRHVYHQFVVRSTARDALRGHLAEAGIGAAVLYPLPVHRQPGYCDRVLRGPNGLAVSEQVCAELLCLPVYPTLTDADVERVAAAVRDWARSRPGGGSR